MAKQKLKWHGHSSLSDVLQLSLDELHERLDDAFNSDFSLLSKDERKEYRDQMSDIRALQKSILYPENKTGWILIRPDLIALPKSKEEKISCPYCKSEMTKSGDSAFVEMGEWNGKNFENEFDATQHKCVDCNKTFII